MIDSVSVDSDLPNIVELRVHRNVSSITSFEVQFLNPAMLSLWCYLIYLQAIQRTYDLPGPLNPTAKPLRQTAGEVMAYFKALNYDVSHCITVFGA